MMAIAKGYAGLMQNRPSKRDHATAHDYERRLAQESLRILPGLLAERSGGGFAGSPDVPASALDPRIVYSLHAGYRVECETSGLITAVEAESLARSTSSSVRQAQDDPERSRMGQWPEQSRGWRSRPPPRKAETPKAGRLKSEDHVAADSIAYTD